MVSLFVSAADTASLGLHRYTTTTTTYPVHVHSHMPHPIPPLVATLHAHSHLSPFPPSFPPGRPHPLALGSLRRKLECHPADPLQLARRRGTRRTGMDPTRRRCGVWPVRVSEGTAGRRRKGRRRQRQGPDGTALCCFQGKRSCELNDIPECTTHCIITNTYPRWAVFSSPAVPT